MSLTPLQRAFIISSSFIILTIFAATWWAQSIVLELNEKACRLNFGEDQIAATLALKNTTSRLVDVNIKLELIDQSDRLRYRAERDDVIKSGNSAIDLTFTKVEYKGIALSDENMWYRLRYVISLKDDNTILEGTISASEITPDIFDLQVFAASQSRAGMKYHARLLTAHPITGLPVEGVKINVVAKYESYQKEYSIKVSTSTDQNGYGQITFDLPKDFAEDDDLDFNLEFIATKGNQRRTQNVSLDLLQSDTYLVTTDKTLYQPEQTIHTRILLFDAQKQARANFEMEAVIEDGEEQNVFRTKLKTSKFGVASFDWTIPDNAQLGGYKIIIGKRSLRQMWGEAQIRVSRYDLPTFAVNAKPDKLYYLPGENAEVEVKADYLFGQPLTKGTVKIVRETERHWNNKTYQYDVEEGETYRGEIDANGKFIAKIDLKKQHEDFQDSKYSKFEDVHFAAYVTDTTTGRTEPRKFDVRLTKEPIHLYLIKDEKYTPNQPIDYYVNASYADGSPAQCEVKVFQVIKNDDPDKENEQQLVKAVLTNKYGIVKVIAFQGIKADGDDDNDIELVLKASDPTGKTGRLESEINLDDDSRITISTNKTLYRAGEPIKVEIRSSVLQAHAMIEVLNEKARVYSQMIQIKDGLASVVIPYQSELKDEITIAVYANVFDEESVDHEFVYSSRNVLYPRDRELKVEMKLVRQEYQPGASVNADLRVTTADGKPVNSVLGAVIVDTAVSERERTDNNFRGDQGAYRYYYEGGNIAGITRRDFDKIDPRQSIPEGFDLIAEVLMRKQYADRVSQYYDSKISRNLNSLFRPYFDNQLRPIRDFLESEYKSKAIYPKDIPTLRNILRRINIDPKALYDPWGTAYHIGFLTIGENDQMALLCAGADKKLDTYDDFIALDISRLYFRFTGEAISRAVANYQARTGDYIRTAAALKDELKRTGIDFDSLRDAWGMPYFITFHKDGNVFRMVVKSAGKDQKVAPEKSYSSDDIQVWSGPLDYISDLQHRINNALETYQKSTKKYPGDVTTFNEALQLSGIDLDAQRDPLGHKYYARVRSQFFYSSRTEIIDYAKAGEKTQSKTEITPVTQTYISFAIRGVGEDDIQGTQDDYEVTTFSRVIAEQDSQSATPEKKAEISASRKENSGTSLSQGISGGLSGIVTDASGAIIPNAVVTVTNDELALTYSAKTNSEGLYFIRDITPGVFKVKIDAAGFKRLILTSLAIAPSRISKLDIMLQIGSVSESVEVSASVEQMQTESGERSNTLSSTQITDLPLKGRNVSQLLALQPGVSKQADISTPRLREYFPETLLWQPNIETDKQGRTQLKFKLADNITTWKLSLIGSTVDGQIGTIEKDIRAFQPFFAELDPPKVLTEGDEIALPVVLRNYLDKPQSVDVQLKPESWFTMLSPARKKSEVKANDSTNEIFNFRAIASINKGKQRVTAIGSAASDAIEKTVNVHPDGEEIAETSAGVFNETGTLEINLPKESIAGSVRGELKIYPNLLAHVTEGIEGILQRPHGCGEQTISSTYPNVMALRLLKSSGIEKHAIEKTAQKYTKAGYDRLLGYQDASGGFTYWGKGEPDLALTAYALRFLNDADEVIDVKEDVIEEAEKWLFKQQRNDGHWSVNEYYKSSEDTRRSMMYTALIARAVTSGGAVSKEYSINLERAFVYLEKELKAFNEPYALANYVIAAQQAGGSERAKWAIDELRKLPQPEAGGNYWALETNTPFYGWGLAGRIETTALVIKALSKNDGKTVSDAAISKGVFWLLRNKDRYGVWLSTQATINVLDAFISLNDSNKNSPESNAEIFVNGSRATSVTMPPGQQLVNPITVDLSKFLAKGKNRIEIKRPSNGALASAQLVETYYLPWSVSMATQAENLKLGAKRALRLAVTYDKPEVKIGEEIVCKVEAERIGFSGYGMMLAEIGLPPGVDVDRASLEAAVKEEGWGINHYDVLPDRVILYLWPRAGGTKFNFKFKSRYGINAMNAASILYDYYNPEARAVVVPVKFIVK